MADIEEILKDDEELTKVSKLVFDAVDSDHSGHIDQKELKTAMVCVAREAGIEPPTDEQVEEAMKALDTDNSGTVDVNEFKELIRQLLEAISC